MAEKPTPEQIAAMPFVRFGEAGPGDFIEIAGGVWQEILCLTWTKKARRWSVTTADKREHSILMPDVFRYKKNPVKPEGPAFL